MKDLLLKVLLPNGAVLGIVTLTNLEALPKIGLLAASMIYTVLKCVGAIRGLRQNRE